MGKSVLEDCLSGLLAWSANLLTSLILILYFKMMLLLRFAELSAKLNSAFL